MTHDLGLTHERQMLRMLIASVRDTIHADWLAAYGFNIVISRGAPVTSSVTQYPNNSYKHPHHINEQCF